LFLGGTARFGKVKMLDDTFSIIEFAIETSYFRFHRVNYTNNKQAASHRRGLTDH
jgi:hypothetical protein